MSTIADNLAYVRKNISDACIRAGRDPKEVTLIAVSKTKPVSDIREAMSAGQTVFGENKVQELRTKTTEITEPLSWHMIGHLQLNKVKYLPGMVDMIHSVDNMALAEQIEKECAKKDTVMNILCEVNMAGEESKFGLAPSEVKDFVKSISGFNHIKVKGLMTVAHATDDPESNRVYFKDMKKLMVDINNEKIDNIKLSELSMGMTNDYTIAVEEGATFVRVGTGIFGARNYAV